MATSCAFFYKLTKQNIIVIFLSWGNGWKLHKYQTSTLLTAHNMFSHQVTRLHVYMHTPVRLLMLSGQMDVFSYHASRESNDSSLLEGLS